MPDRVADRSSTCRGLIRKINIDRQRMDGSQTLLHGCSACAGTVLTTAAGVLPPEYQSVARYVAVRMPLEISSAGQDPQNRAGSTDDQKRPDEAPYGDPNI